MELSALNIPKTLPIETVKFINSFTCFDKNDKNILLLYALNNEFMLKNSKDKSLMQKNSIRHMSIFDHVLKVENKCLLNDLYKHIDKSMTLTLDRKKDFKIAKRYMNSGTYPQLTKIDKALIRREIANFNDDIQTFKQTESAIYLDITSIKKHQKNSIPKRTMHFIKTIPNITDNEQELLLYYANNLEKRLQNYDDPQIQKKLIDEEIILNACLQNTSYKLDSSIKLFLKEYPGSGSLSFNVEKLPQSFINLYSTLTHTRKDIANIINLNYGHGRKKIGKDELEKICSNLKNPTLTTFDQGFKKKKKSLHNPKKNMTDLVRYIDEIFQVELINKRFKRYVTLSYLIAESEALAFTFGLEHYQLESCLKDKVNANKLDIFMNKLNDSLIQDKKYFSYKNNLKRSSTWWIKTLALKASAEGFGAIFNTYGCSGLIATEEKMNKLKNKKPGIADATIKGKIFDNYNVIYEKEKFTKINNTFALEKGIVYPAWFRDNKLHSKNGGEIILSNTQSDGLKLTFKDYPGGEECNDLMRMNNSFSTDYSDAGLTAIINGEKISLSNYKKITEICNSFQYNDIIFIENQ